MEKIAKCPVCSQGELLEGTNSYSCNYFKSLDDKCGFRIYETYYGKNITKEIVLQLIEQKQTDVFEGLVSKEGKTFNARLIIEDGHVKPKFEQRRLESSCPKCAKSVLITGKAFACEDFFNDKACDFYMNKTIAGVVLSDEDAELLLNGQTTSYRTDFISQKNNEFGAKITLDDDFNTKLIFEITSCPKCKTGSILANAKAFGCSNFKDPEIKCDFVVWRNISGKAISIKELSDLCEKGSTSVIKSFKKKTGEIYSGKLAFSDDHKVIII